MDLFSASRFFSKATGFQWIGLSCLIGDRKIISLLVLMHNVFGWEAVVCRACVLTYHGKVRLSKAQSFDVCLWAPQQALGLVTSRGLA